MSQTYRRHLLASTLMIGAAAIAAPLNAQTAVPGSDATPATSSPQGPAVTVPQQAMAAQPDATGQIVVTGSLIRNPNLTSVAPVTTISQNEISLRQSSNAEELVRDIPGAVPGIGSQVNNGTGGAATVNLRGLGFNRNLVLLDGQRLVPYGLNGVVDLNNIPVALVERTDVLTGGASTTYGADAIAGVVNFITRSDFAGVDATVSYGITEKGDGRRLRAEATIGGNFDDDKGNAVFSISYQQVRPVYQGDRNFSYYAIDSYSGVTAGSGTTVPARLNGVSLVNADGTTTPAIRGSRQVNPTTGTLGAYNQPYNFNPLNIFQTPYERFNIYGAAHYNLTDNIEFYTRGLFSKNTVSQVLAESGAFSLSVDVPFSNPYLPAGIRSQICTAGGLSAAQCAASAAATSTSDPNYRTFRTTLGRRLVEAGPRITNFNTTMFDYRAGLRGDITDNLHWDVSGSYGQSDLTQDITGNSLNSRFKDALLATNASTCLSGNTNCVPVNIFGAAGSITPSQLSYLLANSTIRTQTALAQVHGQLTGELPVTSPFATDAISFAVGGEYRYYSASIRSDELSKSGDIGGSGGAQPDVNGSYYVYEGFAEADAPLVQDRPFFKLLDIQAGIRRSQYLIKATGTPKFGTTTWKAGANWQPISDIKFRGNYQHAVRAPNIGELFTPVTTGLTNLASDPCAGSAPTTNANLRAVCLAQGAPASTIGFIGNPTAGQGNITTGGNPSLKPEVSNSYTAGIVLTPTFLRGFTASVDYYDIKIKKAITTPTPQDLVGACFNNLSAASATSSACTVIRRDPNTGQLDGDPASVPGLFGALSNLGKLHTSGVDLTAAYTRNFGFAKLNLSFNGNWTRTSTFQATPTSVNRECVRYYSANCASLQPKFSWNQRTTVSIKAVDLSLYWRHIGSMKYEPLDAAANGDAYVGTLPAITGLSGNYDFGRIKPFNYFDFAVRLNAGEHMDFTATAYNITNKKPPLVGYDIGNVAYNSGNTYPSTYDPLGRAFQVSAHIKF